MSNSFQNLISGHWKEILLVLIPILLIRLVRYFLHKRKMNKKLREEKELAARLMQDEALNDEILNPGRKEGDVEERKYPYKVSYAENGKARRGGQARAFPEASSYEKSSYEKSSPDTSSQNVSQDAPFHEGAGLEVPRRGARGRGPDQEAAGLFLKVEEHSGFSVKSYMYRRQEVMRVGNRYGKTDIIAGDTGGCTLYFEIYCKDEVFCVRSFGNAEVTVQRGRQRKTLGQAAVILRNDDRIKVEDRVYVVSFV